MTQQYLPTVSVIIPAYNVGKTIDKAIHSVITQSYKHIEVIIVDGGSSDNTLTILKSLRQEYPISFISEKDKGVYDAMNKGIRMAKGEWLYFLGADDRIYDADVVENVITSMNSEQFDVIYGDVLFENSQKKYGGAYHTIDILQQNISHQAIFYRKNLFDRFGDYELKYPILADYVFNLRWFAQKNVKRKYIKRTIAIFGEEGLSSTKRDLVYKKSRVRLVKENFGLFWFLYALLAVPIIDKIKKIRRKIIK